MGQTLETEDNTKLCNAAQETHQSFSLKIIFIDAGLHIFLGNSSITNEKLLIKTGKLLYSTEPFETVYKCLDDRDVSRFGIQNFIIVITKANHRFLSITYMVMVKIWSMQPRR